MSASSDNRAWRRSSQQLPPRNSTPQREESNSRNKENMVRKAIPQTPSPAPTSNPWSKGAGPVKAGAGGQSGTSTPKEQAVSQKQEQEQERSPAPQATPAFNADDVRRLFSEDTKKALEKAGPDVFVNLPEEGKKQAWGAQRKPGTMANGQNFAHELAKLLAEAETKSTS